MPPPVSKVRKQTIHKPTLNTRRMTRPRLTSVWSAWPTKCFAMSKNRILKINYQITLNADLVKNAFTGFASLTDYSNNRVHHSTHSKITTIRLWCSYSNFHFPLFTIICPTFVCSFLYIIEYVTKYFYFLLRCIFNICTEKIFVINLDICDIFAYWSYWQ